MPAWFLHEPRRSALMIDSRKWALGSVIVLTLLNSGSCFLCSARAGETGPPSASETGPALQTAGGKTHGYMRDLYFQNRKSLLKSAADRALLKYPGDPELYYFRSISQCGNPKTRQEAMKDINTAIRLNPKAGSYHCVKAMIYLDEEEDAKALPPAMRACELQPERHDHWIVLSTIQRHLGKTYDSVKSATEAIRRDRNGLAGRQARARAYMSLKKWKEALEDLNVMIKAEPASVSLRTDRARVSAHLRNWDAVISDATFGLGKTRNALNRRNLLRDRAAAYAAKKEYGKAIADYTQARKLFAYDRETIVSMKRLYETMGDMKAARALGQTLAELDEDMRPTRN